MRRIRAPAEILVAALLFKPASHAMNAPPKVVISRVEIYNFKSFQRATVELSRGFNCITGANGCGKSCLLDAVLFALGATPVPQHTRVKSLGHLVNNGSGGPHGKGVRATGGTLTLASVALVFSDNSSVRSEIRRTPAKRRRGGAGSSGRRRRGKGANAAGIAGDLSVVRFVDGRQATLKRLRAFVGEGLRIGVGNPGGFAIMQNAVGKLVRAGSAGGGGGGGAKGRSLLMDVISDACDTPVCAA